MTTATGLPPRSTKRDSDGRTIQTHSWTYYSFSSSVPAGRRGLLQSETIYEIPLNLSASQSSLSYCTRTYTYDVEGRVTGVSESWSDGWTSSVSTTYDFLGNVLSVSETHTSPSGSSETINTSYTYDGRGRKLTCSRSLSGDETGSMSLATVTYTYDALGRPSGKTVTGTNGSILASEDIGLDIHGWTTGISAKDNSNVPFFFENLSYTNPSRSISTARFDGNISEITSVHNVTPANGSSVAIYSYNYDGMKRLADARHTGISTLLTESDKNTERYISYDRNGNITGLTRYDSNGNADAITFSHTGNRMTSVNGNSYSYDSAGNMTRDGRKGLDISYNCLNLPSHAVTADGSSLTYTYLADGTKMLVTNSGRGLRYIGLFTFSVAGANNFALESIACDEGRFALVSGGTSSPASLKDLFFVTDHLGNVRSIADVSPGLTAPVILEQNDYLPFGTKVQNSSYASITENRYRYAGKEEQNIGGINLSLLDFGARSYDPYVARWTSVDPMADKYFGVSPFNYCNSSPIVYYDPYGNNWYSYTDSNGETQYFYVEGQLSNKDIKAGSYKDLGYTYTDTNTNTYYSLFGKEIPLYNQKGEKTVDGALYPLIDQVVIQSSTTDERIGRANFYLGLKPGSTVQFSYGGHDFSSKYGLEGGTVYFPVQEENSIFVTTSMPGPQTSQIHTYNKKHIWIGHNIVLENNNRHTGVIIVFDDNNYKKYNAAKNKLFNSSHN